MRRFCNLDILPNALINCITAQHKYPPHKYLAREEFRISFLALKTPKTLHKANSPCQVRSRAERRALVSDTYFVFAHNQNSPAADRDEWLLLNLFQFEDQACVTNKRIFPGDTTCGANCVLWRGSFRVHVYRRASTHLQYHQAARSYTH